MAYNAFLVQDGRFKDFFEMLKDQYQRYPESFKKLTKADILRIKIMQDSYDTNTFRLFDGPCLELNTPVPGRGEKSEKKHFELIKEVYKRKESTLEPHTGIIESACLEYPVRYGNIDLMVISNNVGWILEFKTETADHSIVGQLMKYFIGLSLQLINKFFNDIRMIAICPGYEQSTYNSLKGMGVRPLVVESKSFKVHA
jgi:hypothetical protein